LTIRSQFESNHSFTLELQRALMSDQICSKKYIVSSKVRLEALRPILNRIYGVFDDLGKEE